MALSLPPAPGAAADFARQSKSLPESPALSSLLGTSLPWLACERNLAPELVLDASFDVLLAASELCPLAAAGLLAHSRIVATLALGSTASGESLALSTRAVLDAAREAHLLLAGADGGTLRAESRGGALVLSGESAPAPLLRAADLLLVAASGAIALVSPAGDPGAGLEPRGDPRAAGAALVLHAVAVPGGLHASARAGEVRSQRRLARTVGEALASAVHLGAARRALAELGAAATAPVLARTLLLLDAAELSAGAARTRLSGASRSCDSAELAPAARLVRAAHEAVRRAARTALRASASLAPRDTPACATIAAHADALARAPLPGPLPVGARSGRTKAVRVHLPVPPPAL